MSFLLQLPDNFIHFHFPVTDSTMSRLRDPALSSRKEDFVLVTADYQTAGHGQRGTSWEAEAGKNLLFGFLCHPTFVLPDTQFRLSEALALAVAGAVGVMVEDVAVKWPNDIYWRNRKICGMLLEHDLCAGRIASTFTGVGLNVNQRYFMSDAPNPASLYQILGHEVCREALLADILQRFLRHYRSLQNGGAAALDAAYAASLYRRTGYHPYSDAGGAFRAVFQAVLPDGRLLLRDERGKLRVYAFKELKFEPETPADVCHE